MIIRRIILCVWLSTASIAVVCAQSIKWVSSTEKNVWKQSKIKLQSKASQLPALEVNDKNNQGTFKAWGTCFNELGWDALNILSKDQQETILRQLFSPDGDLRFTIGRLPMNANDYARDWYSCDEVSGDFSLKYFNIDRDKDALIPYIQRAQHYNPALTFWISPWSPPSWMKTNHHYAMKAGKFNEMSDKSNVPPIVNDQFILDKRYLQAYADYFCRYISAYREQGIPITTVMYQNEAYSYTPYPGCAWTAEGTILFNSEYLAPTLAKQHPGVELYLGTINTNRFDVIDKVLADTKMAKSIKGIGFQWEGGQILPKIRAKYPQFKYVQSESECGWGSFDWKGAEHTFDLINHYLGNGCEQYTFWNAILADNGSSTWGWKQNAFIRVDSKSKTCVYTPEYYAVKHYSNYVSPGSRLVAFQSAENKLPVLVFITPEKNYVVIAGNFNNTAKSLSVKIGNKFINVSLSAHSFNTMTLEK